MLSLAARAVTKLAILGHQYLGNNEVHTGSALQILIAAQLQHPVLIVPDCGGH